MPKFFGKIGYGETQETTPGVWKDVIVEREYYGDIIRNSRGLANDEKVNSDITVSNSISIVADAYAQNHFFAMRYIEWAGTRWIVEDVDASVRPRLLLRLGGVYHGPTPTAPDAP